MATKNDIEDHIDSLDEIAEDIEDAIRKFANHISPGHIAVDWPTPHGEGKDAQREARHKYEIWYRSALPIIEDYQPSSTKRFKKGYTEFQRHIKLNVEYNDQYGPSQLYSDIVDIFDEQRNLLMAIPSAIDARRLKSRQNISSRLTRDEIHRARALFNNEFIRASGVVASVALERHLLTLCENSPAIETYEPNHGISRLSQTLYVGEVIDKTTWNDLKALASIRETCAHPDEPKKEAVRRLINESEEFIRDLPTV